MLSLGIDSLRRGVTVTGDSALHPTRRGQRTRSEPASARSSGKTAAPVTVTTDGLGLFTGVPAPLAGFRTYQPVLSVAAPGRVQSSAAPSGAGAAIVGYSLGGGIVVDHRRARVRCFAVARRRGRALIDRIWTVVSK